MLKSEIVMLVTNFKESDETLYRGAIRLFGDKDLRISFKAKDINGVECTSLMSLYCDSHKNLHEFWKFFDKLKNAKWCIINNRLSDKKLYYCWNKSCKYHWTSSKDEVGSNVLNNTSDHPFLFLDKADAIKFMKASDEFTGCRVVRFI